MQTKHSLHPALPGRIRRAFFLTALGIFVFHGLFHFLADELGMGYNNPLGAIWGPNVVGSAMHGFEFVWVSFTLWWLYR